MSSVGSGRLPERGDTLAPPSNPPPSWHPLGHLPRAARSLLDVGVGAQDSAREPIALVLGALAMRQPAAVLAHLETRTDLDAAVLVLRDAFDMLDEDLEEEHFFMTARAAFWGAPEQSSARVVAEELIRVLEF